MFACLSPIDCRHRCVAVAHVSSASAAAAAVNSHITRRISAVIITVTHTARSRWVSSPHRSRGGGRSSLFGHVARLNPDPTDTDGPFHWSKSRRQMATDTWSTMTDWCCQCQIGTDVVGMSPRNYWGAYIRRGYSGVTQRPTTASR